LAVKEKIGQNMKTSKLISGLLTLLGFGAAMAGCSKMYAPPDDGGGMSMYGTPTASFEVKGRVTDDSGDPVRDIKIVVKEDAAYDYEIGVGITDAHGYYSVRGSWSGSNSFNIATEDIDGEKNGGEFATESVEIEIKKEDYIGGEGWNRGKVTKNADFELELKSQEDETK
jgi:putative lipoprotein (rSAM/lipoprotein system)